jgi:hypothetical protein
MHGVAGLQDFLGAGADEIVVGQLCPANLAARIQQKLTGTRNVGAANSRVRMHQVPQMDDLRLVVGEKQKRIASGLPKMLRDIGRVHADGNDTDLPRIELGQPLLKTP